MKSHPILFSKPMVLAILAGRKTQTRRVIKPQPQETAGKRWRWGYKLGAPKATAPRIMNWCEETIDPHDHPLVDFARWQSGDQLWVRETWCQKAWSSKKFSRAGIIYRADGDHELFQPWRPSIHMPRWASRITLEVLEVRVERLQDITYMDTKAEGIEDYDPDVVPGGPLCTGFVNQLDFANLWDTINAKRGYSWDTNPWVWVIEFRKQKS